MQKKLYMENISGEGGGGRLNPQKSISCSLTTATIHKSYQQFDFFRPEPDPVGKILSSIRFESQAHLGPD